MDPAMAEAVPNFFQRNKRWILPILILGGAVAIFVLLIATKPTAPSQPVKERVWTVKVISAEYGSYAPKLSLYGQIEAPSSSTLSAPVTAFVESRNISEGELVEAGQLLLKLDNRDANLLLAQRQADMERIEAQIQAEKVRYQSDLKALKIEKELVNITLRTLERYKNLSSRQVASQNQLDDARRTKQQQALSLNSRQQAINDHPNRLAQLEAQLKQTKALRDIAALDLERTRIIAPFPGRIASINVAAGDRVRSGDSLLNIYNTEKLEVRAQIPSRFLPVIRQQLAAKQNIQASAELDGQQMNLTLERLAAAVEGGGIGIDGLFSISNNDYSGEPGRSIALNLSMPEQPQLLALPPQAIFGTDRIYIVQDQRLVSRQIVRVGDSLDQNGKPLVLVQSNDLKAGDQILITQLPNAVTGLLVKIAGQKTSAAATAKAE
ncbi:RND transporter [Amphritea balenae]|nr:RND transporter [Amphritea balenae]